GLPERADGQGPPEAIPKEQLELRRVGGQRPLRESREPHESRGFLILPARERARPPHIRHARLTHHAIGFGHGLPRVVDILLRRGHGALPARHLALRQGATLEEILACRRQLLLPIELALLGGEHRPRVARYFTRSRRALAASCSRRASSERTGAAAPARGVCPCDAGGVARMTAERPSRTIRQRAAEELSTASGRQLGEEGQPLRGLLAPDLRDLEIAIVGQALLVAPEILVEPLDLLVRPGAGEGRPVQDVELGDLGRVELTRLGNGGFLIVAEGPILDACFLVLLAEALHRKLVCALGPVAGHAASVAEGPGTLCLTLVPAR